MDNRRYEGEYVDSGGPVDELEVHIPGHAVVQRLHWFILTGSVEDLRRSVTDEIRQKSLFSCSGRLPSSRSIPEGKSSTRDTLRTLFRSNTECRCTKPIHLGWLQALIGTKRILEGAVKNWQVLNIVVEILRVVSDT